MIVSVSPHKFSWLCQFLHISFCDCVSFSKTDTITKTYVEKLTQSWKLMWRNWHNHEKLCGETDTITKTYVEKLTQSQKRMWRNWHNHENLCGETDTIMKTYVEKLTQSWKLMWRNWHNHEKLCGETDTITKTYVSVSPHKFSWLCQFLHINFHDCVSFSK
jgi:G3E family GTPase